jgi:hypothetical protein
MPEYNGSEESQAVPSAQELATKVSSLMGYVSSLWGQASAAKESTVRKSIDEGVLAMRSIYTDEQNKQIDAENGMSKSYFSTTSQNSRAAVAWLMDIVRRISFTIDYDEPELTDEIKKTISDGVNQRLMAESMAVADAALTADPSAALTPASDASLLQQSAVLIQQAEQEWLRASNEVLQKKAAKMTKYINEIKKSNELMGEIKSFVTDLMWSPSAVLGGPFVRDFTKIDWVVNPATNRTERAKSKRKLPTHLRVNPYDIYPDPDSDDIRNSYVFQVHRLTRKDLLDLIDVPGFDSAAIRNVLLQYTGGHRITDITTDQRKKAENKDKTEALTSDNVIETLAFYGYVSGKKLKESQLLTPEDTALIEDSDELFVNLWHVDGTPIGVQVFDDDEAVPPYRSMSYSNIVKSVWGDSLAGLNADSQALGNAGIRGVQTNGAYAAQPISSVNKEMVPQMKNSKLSRIPPGTVLLHGNDQLMGNTAPVNWFAPPNNVASFLSIMDASQRYSAVSTGIPESGTGGVSGQGASETASGLAMIRTDTGRIIKEVVLGVQDIIIHCIQDYYEYVMEFGGDESAKIQADIVAIGVESILAKEVRTRRISEVMGVTAGGIYSEVMGPEAAASILIEVLKDLDINRAVDAVEKNLKSLGGRPDGVVPQGTSVKKETEVGSA